MKKIGMIFLIFIAFCTLLSSCAFKSERYSTTKKSERLAVLLDPEIRKNYREFKKTAEQAHLYQKNGKTYIAADDMQKLNAISATLVDRLHNHYHLNLNRYKPHTYIGKNAYNSCYQYYNSLFPHQIGKSCNEFSHSFGTCSLCNEFIKKVRAPHNLRIMHARWRNNEKVTTLIEVTRLRNGDSVYVGLELSAEE